MSDTDRKGKISEEAEPPVSRAGVVYFDASSNFHPYDCDGRGKCVHCDRATTERHDPATCALCDPEYDMAPNPHRGLTQSALPTPKSDALQSAEAQVRLLTEALSHVLEWPLPSQGGRPQTVETWSLPGWLAREARAALASPVVAASESEETA